MIVRLYELKHWLRVRVPWWSAFFFFNPPLGSIYRLVDCFIYYLVNLIYVH